MALSGFLAAYDDIGRNGPKKSGAMVGVYILNGETQAPTGPRFFLTQPDRRGAGYWAYIRNFDSFWEILSPLMQIVDMNLFAVITNPGPGSLSHPKRFI